MHDIRHVIAPEYYYRTYNLKQVIADGYENSLVAQDKSNIYITEKSFYEPVQKI